MDELFSDFAARYHRSRDRRLAFDEVIGAVRSVSSGKSKDEVRDLLVAELRGRSIRVPDEPFLGHMADRVLADDDILTQLRLSAQGLGALKEYGAKVVNDLKHLLPVDGLNVDLGDVDIVHIPWDTSEPGAPVVLDPDAQHWFTANTDVESRPLPSDIVVVLTWAVSGPESGQVAVRAGDRRVGVLTTADSEDFRPALDDGSERNRPAVTEGRLERTSDATWRLTVYRPRTSA
jgi:hypothetical protein